VRPSAECSDYRGGSRARIAGAVDWRFDVPTLEVVWVCLGALLSGHGHGELP
jgi:hypothetical protein